MPIGVLENIKNHGFEQGIEEKTFSVVKNMLAKNYPYETMAELTETSIEKIMQIAESLKSKISS